MFRASFSFSAFEIQVFSYQPAEWGDSWMGLATADEMCAEVITPGWIIGLQGQPGGKAVFRTNQSGSSMRRAPDTEIPTKKTYQSN